MKERLKVESQWDVMFCTWYCCQLNKDSVDGMQKEGMDFKVISKEELAGLTGFDNQF